ncbi:Ig-like domain-containing protein [Segatella bryantii]|uniref:fimbrillin family protein n=1 Tax=Segatella bryantii TaxID=77095 RepID=UPI001EDC07AD|nr:Ig-like domain-containing protein [Segatella bryantii]UKK72109.1 Ig-like domain-containing protein [Segatella bryantii]
MKATKYISMAALALMGVLASCQSDDETVSITRPNNAVSVNFSVGSLQGTTRSNAAATDDTQRQFNQGDQISVSTNDQEAVIFQCTSTENQTWTEVEANKFLLWTQNMLAFSAYYPVTTGTSMTTFTLPADQSSEAKIALADYMTRQQNISRPESGSDIQMQLERKMARVIVRISGFGSQYDDDEKTVSNVSIYSEASGIEDGNSTGSSTEITPYAQGDGGQGSTYTALVVPGYGDSGAHFIRLTDGEYNTLLVKGIPELEAGNSYTFNLVVGKNRIEVASVTVQDWTTGEILAGGQAQEQGSAATLVTAITLNKTATTISAGNTETLSVSSVTPDDATDQTVTWSSDNEAVATVDADGKVTAVAFGTANITATANDGSGVTATCVVTVSKVVTINQSDWGSDWNPSFTKDGVTVSAGMIDPHDGNLMDGGTFSTTLGNFTKIVVTTQDSNVSGTGWSGGGSSKTWAGTPASTVSFSGEFMGMGQTQTTIVCTIVPTN